MSTGRIRRGLAAGAVTLAGAVLLALAGPGVGSAAAAAPCPGHKVRTLGFSTGKVVLYKKRGYVCAVTYSKTPGARKSMSVSVQARGSRPVRDKGNFTRLAGPVKVHSGHRCVWVKGSVGRGSVSTGWILC
ncbi:MULTISPECIES: hypothetical protein [Streptomyces]|uniref:Secreted protein n=1 Tax=Streptomyces lasiicapitis TaxID=1923961 RepID=A0ABQ2MP07_9ACTN|nr:MULTISPECIES: hypothetical protein [Streptomyces]QIB45715.1 hypothetical protein G3H79_24210 [Streptomyces aureoverticillatus]GGO55255.1 hypothetical protein GCM10012286_66930 [Streptomyces lasiicapitis]